MSYNFDIEVTLEDFTNIYKCLSKHSSNRKLINKVELIIDGLKAVEESENEE